MVIGHVGTLGGPAGVALAPILGGVQLWVKYINKVGGLNGHEVKLVVYDDGGDPARHRAQLQQAVEKNGAIAFLANTDPITGQSGLKYLEDKQIPHVGTTNGVPWAYDSPMYFPQQSDGEPGIISWLAGAASQMVPAGKTKLASLTCLEAQGCADADRIYSTVAKQFGFDLVYRSRASIAQPDYTAECLNARSAGATTFMVILDQNSVARVASACARQGYKPNFATIGTIIDNKQKDDPNLAGMVGAMNVFPWFQTGTPAADEFRHALADVGKQISATVGTTIGWTAGKLLQKAATALPEPPTNAAILQGLWAMKGETLGGITGPLTFTQGKPATKETCWFNLALKEQWVSPDDFKIHCL